MRNPISIIAEAWGFLRKQPVLFTIAFWLLFLPMTALTPLSRYTQFTQEQTLSPESTQLSLLASLASLVLGIVMIWGICSVLVVGRRLLATKAGKHRTSFTAVCTQARPLVIPLLLTSLLRSIIMVLWTMLLIVPGIIYGVRTSLTAPIVANEGVAYSDALRKSRTLVYGKTWLVFLQLLVFCILIIFIPLRILSVFVKLISDAPWSALVIDLLQSALAAIFVTLFVLCLILLYKDLLPNKGPVTGTMRKAKG